MLFLTKLSSGTGNLPNNTISALHTLGFKSRMKKVLFLSHELSATGAPKMLYYAALAVKNSGGFPTVFSPIDGVMRQKLTQADIPVVINQRISLELVQNFEVVVVNTVIQAAMVRALVKIPGLTVVWWLHESQLLTSVLGNNKDLADSNVRIICVSEYAKSFMPVGFHAEVLLNGIPDDVPPAAPDKSWLGVYCKQIPPSGKRHTPLFGILKRSAM
ncbi:hypothetical protein [Conservatibacter flavescens]|uniref:Glycosyltransferase subfamily 4-like N-terminal domain-containing protein n=1 Tax=Conservatibacter flavescens TaxID=28161 RepID=A0A2M8S5F1_9PAST|nr:hypothetical protein [Conservatibacter flavescens]PJG86351.1 hypothetical protein CVP05_00630 [Conservatibacter flavescens]